MHGSDIQDWVIDLRPGYWADPVDIINDMVRSGLIRRGAKMLRAHQELAERTMPREYRHDAAHGWGCDNPLHYWYVAVGLDTTPSHMGKTLAEIRADLLSSPD